MYIFCQLIISDVAFNMTVYFSIIIINPTAYNHHRMASV